MCLGDISGETKLNYEQIIVLVLLMGYLADDQGANAPRHRVRERSPGSHAFFGATVHPAPAVLSRFLPLFPGP